MPLLHCNTPGILNLFYSMTPNYSITKAVFMSVPLFSGIWVELSIFRLFLIKTNYAMDNRIFKAFICKRGKKVLEAVSKRPFPCTCFCDRRVHRLGQPQEIICISWGLGRHQDSSVKNARNT